MESAESLRRSFRLVDVVNLDYLAECFNRFLKSRINPCVRLKFRL